MFDFWYELPGFARVLVGLVLIGLSVGFVLVTGYIYKWNIIVGVLGLVSILFAGAGKNKGGYNF